LHVLLIKGIAAVAQWTGFAKTAAASVQAGKKCLKPDYSKSLCPPTKIQRKSVDTAPQPLNNRREERRLGLIPSLLPLETQRRHLDVPALSHKEARLRLHQARIKLNLSRTAFDLRQIRRNLRQIKCNLS
jgi:hypothetical protein